MSEEELVEDIKKRVSDTGLFGGPQYNAGAATPGYRPCFKFDPEVGLFFVPRSWIEQAHEYGDGSLTALIVNLPELSELSKAVGSICCAGAGGELGSCVATVGEDGKIRVLTSAHIGGIGILPTFVDFCSTRNVERKSTRRPLSLVRVLDGRKVSAAVDVAVFAKIGGTPLPTPLPNIALLPAPAEDIAVGDVIALVGYPSQPDDERLEALWSRTEPAERPPRRLTEIEAQRLLNPDCRVVSCGVITSFLDADHARVAVTAYYGMSGGAAFLLRPGSRPRLIGIVKGDARGSIPTSSMNANEIVLVRPHWSATL